jgi:hypothetical protein
MVIPPVLGRHFLDFVNRVHHLKVRLAFGFGSERPYIRITSFAPQFSYKILFIVTVLLIPNGLLFNTDVIDYFLTLYLFLYHSSLRQLTFTKWWGSNLTVR